MPDKIIARGAGADGAYSPGTLHVRVERSAGGLAPQLCLAILDGRSALAIDLRIEAKDIGEALGYIRDVLAAEHRRMQEATDAFGHLVRADEVFDVHE